jgi:hypothetical protein
MVMADSVTDIIFDLLRDQGYTGTLADMQRAYYIDWSVALDRDPSGSWADIMTTNSLPPLPVLVGYGFEPIDEEPEYVSPWPDPFPSVTSQMNFTTSTVGLAPNLATNWTSQGSAADFVTEAGPLVTYGDATTEGRNIKVVAGATSFRRLGYDQTPSAGPRLSAFYFKLNETPSTSLYLNRHNVSGSSRCDWRINTNRTVSLRSESNVGNTSSQQLAVGTVYWAEYLVNGTTHTIRIYEVDSDTPLLTVTGSCPNTLTDTVFIGHMANFNGHTTFFDRLTIYTDWIR